MGGGREWGGVGCAPEPRSDPVWSGPLRAAVEGGLPPCLGKQHQTGGLFPDSEGRVEGTGHLLPPLSQNSWGRGGRVSKDQNWDGGRRLG